MSTPADGEPTAGFWGCRALRADGTVAWVAGAQSDRHADGAMVELPEAEAIAYLGDATLARAELDSSGKVTSLRVSPDAAPGAPPMWFAELPEEDTQARPTNVLAFSGHDVEPGRLLSRDEMLATGASTSDQLGAIRIYPGTGRVDQIYVSPDWRRRKVGTALMFASGVLILARDLTLMWGDGQRTAEGDRLNKGSVWGRRAAPLTHLAPPMTPMSDR